MSGHTEAWLLWLAVASTAAVVFIAHEMDVVDHEGFPIHLSPAALGYFPWLIREIVKANIDIAKVILSGPGAVSPSVFHVEASQDNDLGVVTYANSITLTPGTVSIGVDETGIQVHALDKGSREGLETGEMDRRVSAMANSRSRGSEAQGSGQ